MLIIWNGFANVEERNPILQPLFITHCHLYLSVAPHHRFYFGLLPFLQSLALRRYFNLLSALQCSWNFAFSFRLHILLAPKMLADFLLIGATTDAQGPGLESEWVYIYIVFFIIYIYAFHILYRYFFKSIYIKFLPTITCEILKKMWSKKNLYYLPYRRIFL